MNNVYNLHILWKWVRVGGELDNRNNLCQENNLQEEIYKQSNLQEEIYKQNNLQEEIYKQNNLQEGICINRQNIYLK